MKLRQENADLRQAVELLNIKVDALVRRIFGARSEKLDPAQLELFISGTDLSGAPDASSGAPEDTAPDTAPTGDALPKIPVDHITTAGPEKARRPRLPDHLPVIEEP